MFIERGDMQFETREQMRGGGGSVELLHAVPKEHLPANTRLFSVITLKTGCGIGKHEHTGETEIFYVLSGEGVLDDNGAERIVHKGDCCICRSGEYHAISNERPEPLVLVAAIILD